VWRLTSEVSGRQGLGRGCRQDGAPIFATLVSRAGLAGRLSLVACASLQEEALCCSVLHAASERFSAVRRGGAPCFWKGVVCHAYGRERGRDEACLTRLWCTDAQSKGEQAKLTISPDYGYGAKGAAGVRSDLMEGLAALAWSRACLLAAAGLPACDACCSQNVQKHGRCAP